MLKHFQTCSLLMLTLCLPALTQNPPNTANPGQPPATTERDGQHDFDFEFGTWKTHLSRLVHPLAGSKTWVDYDGTTVVRKVWAGRANLVELEVAGPAGHIEGLSFRLYNPRAHQWSLNFANSSAGVLTQPTIGEFRNGRGEFFDQETINGRAVFVRFVISDVTADSCRFEQSYSDDGGKTWEVNWIATDTRVKDESEVSKASLQPANLEDVDHGFDFELGSWNIHLKRRLNPLTGSRTWVQFDGTSVTQKVWYGRADLEEFETEGSTGHIEGLTLRLYNPQAHEWNIYWATSNNGVLGIPTIGNFKNGRGEFFDQEFWNGRTILVRFIWSELESNSPHFEQSFSVDGGKSWEVNWITDQTRVHDEADKTR